MAATIQTKAGKQYKLTVEKSPVDNRDFVGSTIYPRTVSLPSVLDYRSDMLVVRDQGAEGTCSAQVVASIKEWQEIKQNKLNRLQARMSPQYIYNERSNKASEGMQPRETMKLLKNVGVCRELLYPYGSTGAPSQRAIDDAKNFRIKSYALCDDVLTLKKALVKNGPCYIAVPVYNNSNEMWYANQYDQLQGGHAMCVVGYNSEGFIIRNSWGLTWGNLGHTIFPYNHWGKHWECWTSIDENSAIPDNLIDMVIQRAKEIAVYSIWGIAGILAFIEIIKIIKRRRTVSNSI